MNSLFFYGTLRYMPLLELVLGRGPQTLDAREACLDGHVVKAVKDEPFPMILRDPGRQAHGLLVQGLNDEDLARLDFYEGGFDYALSPLRVRCADGTEAMAQVFFPQEGLWTPAEDWSMPEWETRWGAFTLLAATEIMSQYGRMSAEAIAARYTPIRVRAAARLAALARTADPDRDLSRDVVVHRHDRPYLPYFSMEEMDLQFRGTDGQLSPVISRTALMVGQASVVLPYDPVRDRVLLVEQFRAPVFIAGDPAPWVWEPVAGLVDPGETPEQAAHREAWEEARLTDLRLEPAGQAYSSTGSSAEFLHLFIGLSDLPDDMHKTGGMLEEGEDLRSRLLSFDELMAGVDQGVFRDLPLLTTALWLARHRDRLRAAA